MKIAYVKLFVVAAAVAALSTSVFAAPVESVESARVTAQAKVGAFLGEKMVADQLQAAGLTSAQAQARLAKLSDAQIEQLAAQVDLIKAGGMIQDSGTNWTIGCIFRQLGTLFHNIFTTLFCWGELK